MLDAARLSKAKRFLFWQITLLPTYLLVALLLVCGACLESARHGPYTTWYNKSLKQRALEASLLGSAEGRVQVVLGAPDNVMQFWEVIGANGLPAPRAKFVTTYEYYPYPLLPFSKFQVHCTGGIVRVLEMFDD